MTDTEKKYIKKKIRPGLLVVDPNETAIVVQYELEGHLLAPDGVTVITELSDGAKRIKVKTLDARTDIDALANEIVTTCKLIHGSKTEKVKGLLLELRERVMSGAAKKNQIQGVHDERQRSNLTSTSSRSGTRNTTTGSSRVTARPGTTHEGSTTSRLTAHTNPDKNKRHDTYKVTMTKIAESENERLLAEAGEDFLAGLEQGGITSGLLSGIGNSLQSGLHANSHTKTHLDDIDEYLEKLYDDDVTVLAEYCGKISHLAKRVENLEHLASHPTLPQTLARVLREEGRKSVDVSVSIVSVFFALSNASTFHPVLTNNQIGDCTLRVLDLELRRARFGIPHHPDTKNAPNTSARLLPIQRTDLYFQNPSDRKRILKLENAGNISDLSSNLDHFEQRRLVTSEKKRDKLLYVALYTLLNVSENLVVERKMKKRDIVSYLMQCLVRSDVDLLTLSVTFLRKLSRRKENVQDMVRKDSNSDSQGTGKTVVDLVARFLVDDGSVPDVLVSQTLRLLRNLSFHEKCRKNMFTRDLLPRLVTFSKRPEHRQIALGLLYHLSVDTEHRPYFAYTECVEVIVGSALTLEQIAVVPELAGLFVNLSTDARCAEALCAKSDAFASFAVHSITSGDPLGCKILRNVSRFARDQNNSPSVVTFFGNQDIQKRAIDAFLLEPNESDVHLELLGLVTDMHRPFLPGSDCSLIAKQSGVFENISSLLNPNECEDDVQLEAVAFVGNYCGQTTVELIVNSGMVELIYELLRNKKDDDAFVLEIVNCFGKFFEFEVTRNVTLQNTQAVFYLIELLKDECEAIRTAADHALDVVYDFDEQWAVKIRRMRFEAHNKEWLEAVRGGGVDDDARFNDRAFSHEERYNDSDYDDDDGFGGNARGQYTNGLVYDDPERYYDEDGRGRGMYD